MPITRNMYTQRLWSFPVCLLTFALISALFQSCSDNSSNPPVNNPPSKPTLIEPADGAVATPTAVTLAWQPATDPDNDSLTYELFFDDVNPPTEIYISDIDSTNLQLLHLSQGTTYFWNVIAFDRKGAGSDPGPIWQFTVGSFDFGWSELAPMPTSRVGAASAVVNGRLYVLGGNSYHGTLNIVESYDPSAGSWTSHAEMPSRRAYAAATELNGIIYVIGGETAGAPQQLLETYNPATNTWSQLEPMPDARTRCAAVLFNNKIYVIGGFAAPPEILVYDVSLNEWQESSTLPQWRYGMSVTNHNGLFYILGGGQPDNMYMKDLTLYDPVTGQLSSRSPAPTARLAHHAALIGDKIYVTGGYNAISGYHIYFASVEVYDIPSDSWITRSRMEFPRHDHAAGVIGNKIYVAGGTSNRSPDILNSLEVYDPELDQ
ncbi:MAG: kelch repeat-containing protein [Candidatus Zixiibacteriota bacterium]